MKQNLPEKRSHGYFVHGMSNEEKKQNRAKIQQLYDQFQQDYGDDPELRNILEV